MGLAFAHVPVIGMSRDLRKVRVFLLADGLVTEIYRVTSAFPAAERFGLQAHLRRAAVSAATNIEGEVLLVHIRR